MRRGKDKMDFLELAKIRRSVRKYKHQPVENEKLRKIFEAARLAPSARNRQPWKFIVITDAQKIKKIADASKGQTFIETAPVIIAAVAYPTDYVCSNGNIAHLVDLGIVGEHIALASADLGLGTCWIAAFFQDRMKKILNVPDDAHIVAIFTIGYPDEESKDKVRKELCEIVVSDKWDGEPYKF